MPRIVNEFLVVAHPICRWGTSCISGNYFTKFMCPTAGIPHIHLKKVLGASDMDDEEIEPNKLDSRVKNRFT